MWSVVRSSPHSARGISEKETSRWPNKAGDLRGRSRERNPTGNAKRGRPPKPNAGVSHAKPPERPANPAPHITLRAVAEIAHARLRTREAYALVEAANREALSLGMKAFEISAAKHINAAMSRAGS